MRNLHDSIGFVALGPYLKPFNYMEGYIYQLRDQLTDVVHIRDINSWMMIYQK